MTINQKFQSLVEEFGCSAVLQVAIKRKDFCEAFSRLQDWTKEAVCQGKTPISIRSKNRVAGHYGRHANYSGTKAQLAQDRSR
jgi:hypothetical protein